MEREWTRGSSIIRCQKRSGLHFLADCLGIRREEIAAFGNAENDLDMMAWAGRGVAVVNAPKDVRALADEVTEANDEDGVALALERFVL